MDYSKLVTSQDVAYFWSRVDKHPEGCWLWQLSHQPTGYGQWAFRYRGRYKTVTTHRLAFSFTFGDIPKNMYVCHTCDIRGCCNPAHLFLGSPTENVWDMLTKKRGSGRDGHATNTKLTAEQVKQIRQAYVPRKGVSVLAKTFGITPDHLRRVALNEVWQHTAK